MKQALSWFILGTGVLLLAACSSKPSPSGRYSIEQDHGPTEAVDLSHIEQPVPKYEAKSAGGNRNYSVWGHSYKVLDSASGYHAKGVASWYGRKFHGHLTSNGETYDMYAFSAAHKTLPLPSYARVTNLNNGKQVIVRINDRGPFHDNRLIDLSYIAAQRLGIIQTGTAPVQVDAIVVPPPWQQQASVPDPKATAPASHVEATSSSPKATSSQKATATPVMVKTTTTAKPQPSAPSGWFVQVFVTRDEAMAKKTGLALAEHFQVGTRTVTNDDLYRLQLGPLSDKEAAETLTDALRNAHYSDAFKVYQEPSG